MLLRYSKKVQAMKWYYILPPAILAVNIFEAVMREIEVSSMNGVIDGMTYVGGWWNNLNAVASTHNPTAYITISIIAFVANFAVAIFQIYTIINAKTNPLKDELYTELDSYKKIKEQIFKFSSCNLPL